MGLLAGIAVMVLAVVVGGLLFAARNSTARNAVWHLVNSGGLPRNEHLMAAAHERLVKREAAAGCGLAAAGLLAGGVLSLAAPDGSKSGFLLALMVTLVGAGLGAYLQHLRAVRAVRPGGPRAATLRQRELGDYLTRREVVGQYAMLGFPLVAVVAGVLVLTTADDFASRGWVLVASGLAAVPIAALAVSLQRRVLALNEPASGVDELRWQEALRAVALRDMTRILVGAGWACGVTGLGFFEWPPGFPGFLDWAGFVVLMGGAALQVLIWQAAETKGGLRRSQAAIQS
jgi:hypothetical protein